MGQCSKAIPVTEDVAQSGNNKKQLRSSTMVGQSGKSIAASFRQPKENPGISRKLTKTDDDLVLTVPQNLLKSEIKIKWVDCGQIENQEQATIMASLWCNQMSNA